LKGFVLDTLSDDTIAFPFVACPASLGFHHNYPGGLLRHSIECAQMVERYQEFAPDKKELGMVAALFHDIGKILTMTPHMRLTSLGRSLDHDKLTGGVGAISASPGSPLARRQLNFATC
jgi:3'-5' exoribonuclease